MVTEGGAFVVVNIEAVGDIDVESSSTCLQADTETQLWKKKREEDQNKEDDILILSCMQTVCVS